MIRRKSFWKTFNQFFFGSFKRSPGKRVAKALPKRQFKVEELEIRWMPAVLTWNAGTSQLDIALDAQDQQVTILSTGTSDYLLSFSNGTLTGSSLPGWISPSGSILQISAAGQTLNAVNITDAPTFTGAGVKFGASSAAFANPFSVTLDNVGAGSVTVTNATTFDGSTLVGRLEVNNAGAIVVNAALTQTGGNTLLLKALGSTGTITSTAAISATNLSLIAASGINVMTAATNFTAVTTVSGDIVINQTGTANFASNINAPANLNITTTTGFTTSGTVNVAGTARFHGGSGDVNLNNSANNFIGALSLFGNNAVVQDTNSLVLGTSNLTGNLTMTTGSTATSNITQTGAVAVGGITTMNLYTGATVDLGTSSNNFGGNVVFNVSGGASPSDVLAGVSLNDSSALALPALKVSGNLTVVANEITQTGVLTVTGSTALNGGAGNITLANANNEFVGAISIQGANNATVVDTNAATLGSTSVTGDLNLTSTGPISQVASTSIKVTGASLFTAGTGNNITLAEAGNNFTGAVSVATANNVTLVDSTALRFGNASVSGALNVTAGGTIDQATGTGLLVTGATTLAAGAANNITLNQANNFTGAVTIASGNQVTLVDSSALQMGNANVNGALSLTATGAITQATGTNLLVTGTTTLAAGSTNDINLNSAGNSFTGAVGVISGANVTLVDSTASQLAASNVTGNLAVTAGGSITQTGALKVTGTSSFTVANGTSVGLGGIQNTFTGTVSISATGSNILQDVSLNDSTPLLSLPAMNINGNLAIVSVGDVSQVGPIKVTGTTSLSAGIASTIDLSNASNNFTGSVTIGSGNNITLNDSSAIDLAASSVNGTLTINAGGNITQSGALTVSGNSSFTTANGSSILLGSYLNTFSGATLSLAATGANVLGDVAIRDNTAVALPAMTVGGTLNVNANNADITQAGAVGVVGTTTLQAGSGNITLGLANNFTGAVTVVSGNNVTLNDSTGIVLGNADVAGNLNVTAVGTISQDGSSYLKVALATKLDAGSGNISLISATNSFTGAVSVVSGNNVTLVDVNAIELGASNVSGDLAVTANGQISQSGPLKVTGATTLSTTVASQNIVLGDNTNNFTGAVSVTTANNVTLNDATGITLGASNVTGTLNVSASGIINQVGALKVTGASSFDSGSSLTNQILLSNTGNNFTGAVSLRSGSASLTDTGTTNLAASTVNGTFTLNANGVVNQTGALSVAGGTTLIGSTADFNLDNAANDFQGTVTIFSANTATLRDANAINLGGSTVNGDFTVTANGITQSAPLTVSGNTVLTANGSTDITLNQASNAFSGSISVLNANNATLVDTGTTQLNTTSVVTNFNLTTDGAITQVSNKTITVTGTATFTTAATADVTLTNAANNFGAVAFPTANNVSVVDSNGVNLAGSNISGNLNVTAGGTIGQVSNTSLVVTGTTTLNSGLTNAINLDNTANNFIGAVSVTNASNVTLTDANAITLGSVTANGTLAVNANGAIGQTSGSAIKVTSTTTLTAGSANNIVLDQTGNNFTGAVSVVSANNVTLVDTNAIELGASNVTGNLNVTATGITQTASTVLKVTGATTLTGGTGNITLNQANEFTGAVSVVSGNNVTLTDANAITLGASNVNGNLNVTAGTNISQTGALKVIGNSTFTTGAAGNLNLNQANTFTGTVTIGTSGGAFGDVTLNDTSSLQLNALEVGGNLAVTAGGDITQTGALKVTGATTLTADGFNITLSNASNEFTGAVSIVSSNNVTLNDASGIELGSSTVNGTLSVTASGDITQTTNTALTVSGTTTLAAGLGNITLANSANNFSSAISVVSGNNVTLTDSNAIQFGASNVSGNLTVLAGGSITQSGVLKVTGTSSFTTTNDSSVTLGSANTFTGAVTFANSQGGRLSSVTLNDTTDVTLGALNLSGNLNIVSGGAISQPGVSLRVDGTTRVQAIGNIDLNNAANNFSGAITVVDGASVTICDASTIRLGDNSSTRGTLTVNAVSGPIIGGTSTIVGGTATFTANSTSDISMLGDFLGGGNNFQAGVYASGANITLGDRNNIQLGTVNANGALTVTTNGAIDQVGGTSLSVTGTTSLTAGLVAGSESNITLDNSANNFTGAVSVITANNVTLVDSSAIPLGGIAAKGNLSVTASGSILQIATTSILVTGTTTLEAGTANNITLNQTTNNFTGAVSITSANNVTLVDASAIKFGNANVTGFLNATASTGDIMQTANTSLLVTGTTSLSAAAGNITLDNAANNFTGAVSIATANNVTLVDADSIQLGTSTINGNLTVTATNATINQATNTTLTVSGTTTLTAGTGNITLANASNNFSGAVGVVSANNVTLADTNAFKFGNANVAGDLTVTANGTIDQATGTSLKVTGATTLAAGVGSITLDNAANNFTGALTVTSGNSLVLVDANAVNVGAMNLTGSLNISAGGDITQSAGPVLVGTTTRLQGFNTTISLNNSSNNFGGAITVVNGASVTLNDANTILLGNIQANGLLDVKATAGPITQDTGTSIIAGGNATFTANATSAITLDKANTFSADIAVPLAGSVTINDTTPATLGNINANGALAVTSNGSISQVSGAALKVTLGTTLTAGTGNISLGESGNSFTGAVSVVSANNVTLVDTNAIELGAANVSGNLTVTANGAISQTASTAIVVTGTTSLTAGTANNITLNQSSNNFVGSVGMVSANAVTLTDANAIELGASNVSGALSVTATQITQTANTAMVVTGATTLSAGSGNITLANTANNFGGAVSVTSANNVTLVDTNAIVLGASNVSGNLNVTAGANISQTGALKVTGNTSLTTVSGSSIVLDQANTFTGTLTLAATSGGQLLDVTINDSNAVQLGALNLSGNLAVTSGAEITQAAAISVGGTTKLASTNPGSTLGTITLDNINNNFAGAVSVTQGNTVSLTDVNAITLGSSNITGDLYVNANGAISGSSAVMKVTGATFLTAGSTNDITLDNANNQFTGAVQVISGANVSLRDNSAIELGSSSVTGTLTVVANGAITQSPSSSLLVTGATSLSAGSTNNITLGQTSNNFTGAVSVLSANNVTLVDSNAAILGASNVSGNLTVTVAAGNITQSGALMVTGNSSFTVGSGGSIDLGTSLNTFTGTVTLGTSSGSLQNVSIRDNSALQLQSMNVNGTLAVEAVGITQASGSVLNVTGATTLTGGSGNITLNQANNFTGSVSVLSGNNVTLVDANAIILGTSSVTGNLNVTATTGDITQNASVSTLAVGVATSLSAGSGNISLANSSNNFGGPVGIIAANNVTLNDANSIQFGNANVSGNLVVSASGTIDQSANTALLVTGTTTLTATSTGNINLSNTANNFTGAVSVVSGNNVTLVDAGSITLGASNVSGNLNVTAGGSSGTIDQTGVLRVTGNSIFTTGNSGTVNLPLANTFTGSVSISNSQGGQTGSVTLNDASDLELGAMNLSGNLNVTSGGNITQAAAGIRVDGTTYLQGSNTNITLSNASNNFSGAVTVVNGADVTICDANTLLLGNMTASGTLTVQAVSGAITQATGTVLSVTGAASFTANGTSAVTLDKANDFRSTVAASGSNITLNDTNSIQLAAVSANGTLAVTATSTINQASSTSIVATGATTLTAGTGNITLDNTANNFNGAVSVVSANNVTLNDMDSITLGASNVAGNLTVTTGGSGSISQTGALKVTGMSTFNVATGGSLNLGSIANTFTGAVALGGNTMGDVSINDTTYLGLNGMAVSGNLALVAGGAIDQSGPFLVTGSTTLTAGSTNNITLNQASNNFTGAVTVVSGNNVALTDVSNLELGNANVSGNLNIATSGALTQTSGTSLIVTGTTTLAVGTANDITLASGSNNFIGAVTVTSADDVTLADRNALVIAQSNISGNLNLTTAGAITQTGPIVVTGTTTLSAGSLSDITLDNASNNFVNAVSIPSALNVRLRDANAITLGGSNITGNLEVTSAGAIVQAASTSLVVTGTTALSAGTANDITLDNTANNFVGAVSVGSGNNILLKDSGALQMGAANVTGNLTLTVGGTLNQLAGTSLLVTGTTNITAGSANITLDSATNNFTGAVSVVSGNNVTLTDANAIQLGATSATGNLVVNATGDISQVGGTALTVTGSTTLTAGTGNVTLSESGNNFNGAVSVVSSNNVTLNDSNAIVLGASNVTGNLTVQANGNITSTGALKVTGNSTFTVSNANSVTLGSYANTFSGSVTVQPVSGVLQDVSLNDTTALELNGMNITGNLSVVASGITQVGSNYLAVTGTTTLNAGTGNISLGAINANSRFTDTLTITANGADIRSGSGGIKLGNVNLGTAPSYIGIDDGTSNITQTANTSIVSSGPLMVYAPNGTSNITLDNNANSFGGGLGTYQVNNFTANAAGDLNLLGISASRGTVTLRATGNITQTGSIGSSGAASFTAGTGKSIILPLANTFTGTVSVGAISGAPENVTINDTVGNLDISGFAANSALNIVSSGNITASTGTVLVTGTTTLRAGSGSNITLDNAGNNFTGAVSITSGNIVTLVDSNTINLGSINATGNLTVSTGGTASTGNITQSGGLVVGGTAKFTAGANAAAPASVILDQTTNNMATVNFAQAAGVTLRDTVTANLVFGVQPTSLDLGATNVTLNGNLGTSGAPLSSISGTGLLTMNANNATVYAQSSTSNFNIGGANTKLSLGSTGNMGITATSANSTLFGNTGNNSFVLSSNLGTGTTVEGGGGTDSVYFPSAQSNYTVYQSGANSYLVTNGSNQATLSNVASLYFNGVPYTPTSNIAESFSGGTITYTVGSTNNTSLILKTNSSGQVQLQNGTFVTAGNIAFTGSGTIPQVLIDGQGSGSNYLNAATSINFGNRVVNSLVINSNLPERAGSASFSGTLDASTNAATASSTVLTIKTSNVNLTGNGAGLTVVANGNRIAGLNDVGILIDGSASSLTNVVVDKVTVTDEDAAQKTGVGVKILGNVGNLRVKQSVLAGLDTGVLVSANAVIDTSANTNNIENSNLSGNTSGVLVLSSATNIAARGNYWGVASNDPAGVANLVAINKTSVLTATALAGLNPNTAGPSTSLGTSVGYRSNTYRSINDYGVAVGESGTTSGSGGYFGISYNGVSGTVSTLDLVTDISGVTTGMVGNNLNTTGAIYDVNNNGTIAGVMLKNYSGTNTFTLFRDPSTGATEYFSAADLAKYTVLANRTVINGSGVVASTVFNKQAGAGYVIPVRWNADGTVTEIPTPATAVLNPFGAGTGIGINASGMIAGTYMDGDTNFFRPFVYNGSSSSFVDNNLFTGNTVVAAIDDTGRILGSVDAIVTTDTSPSTTKSGTLPWLMNSAGTSLNQWSDGLEKLNPASGIERWRYNYPMAINGSGMVVGFSSDTQSQPYSWANNTNRTDTDAWYWDTNTGTVTNLQSLLSSTDSAAYNLQSATDVNANGQITVNFKYKADYEAAQGYTITAPVTTSGPFKVITVAAPADGRLRFTAGQQFQLDGSGTTYTISAAATSGSNWQLRVLSSTGIAPTVGQRVVLTFASAPSYSMVMKYDGTVPSSNGAVDFSSFYGTAGTTSGSTYTPSTTTLGVAANSASASGSVYLGTSNRIADAVTNFTGQNTTVKLNTGNYAAVGGAAISPNPTQNYDITYDATASNITGILSVTYGSGDNGGDGIKETTFLGATLPFTTTPATNSELGMNVGRFTNQGNRITVNTESGGVMTTGDAYFQYVGTNGAAATSLYFGDSNTWPNAAGSGTINLSNAAISPVAPYVTSSAVDYSIANVPTYFKTMAGLGGATGAPVRMVRLGTTYTGRVTNVTGSVVTVTFDATVPAYTGNVTNDSLYMLPGFGISTGSSAGVGAINLNGATVIPAQVGTYPTLASAADAVNTIPSSNGAQLLFNASDPAGLGTANVTLARAVTLRGLRVAGDATTPFNYAGNLTVSGSASGNTITQGITPSNLASDSPLYIGSSAGSKLITVTPGSAASSSGITLVNDASALYGLYTSGIRLAAPTGSFVYTGVSALSVSSITQRLYNLGQASPTVTLSAETGATLNALSLDRNNMAGTMVNDQVSTSTDFTGTVNVLSSNNGLAANAIDIVAVNGTVNLVADGTGTGNSANYGALTVDKNLSFTGGTATASSITLNGATTLVGASSALTSNSVTLSTNGANIVTSAQRLVAGTNPVLNVANGAYTTPFVFQGGSQNNITFNTPASLGATGFGVTSANGFSGDFKLTVAGGSVVDMDMSAAYSQARFTLINNTGTNETLTGANQTSGATGDILNGGNGTNTYYGGTGVDTGYSTTANGTTPAFTWQTSNGAVSGQFLQVAANGTNKMISPVVSLGGITNAVRSTAGTSVTLTMSTTVGLQLGDLITVAGFTGTNAGNFNTPTAGSIVTALTSTTVTYTNGSAAISGTTVGTSGTTRSITVAGSSTITNGDSITVNGYSNPSLNGTYTVTSAIYDIGTNTTQLNFSGSAASVTAGQSVTVVLQTVLGTTSATASINTGVVDVEKLANFTAASASPNQVWALAGSQDISTFGAAQTSAVNTTVAAGGTQGVMIMGVNWAPTSTNQLTPTSSTTSAGVTAVNYNGLPADVRAGTYVQLVLSDGTTVQRQVINVAANSFSVADVGTGLTVSQFTFQTGMTVTVDNFNVYGVAGPRAKNFSSTVASYYLVCDSGVSSLNLTNGLDGQTIVVIGNGSTTLRLANYNPSTSAGWTWDSGSGTYSYDNGSGGGKVVVRGVATVTGANGRGVNLNGSGGVAYFGATGGSSGSGTDGSTTGMESLVPALTGNNGGTSTTGSGSTGTSGSTQPASTGYVGSTPSDGSTGTGSGSSTGTIDGAFSTGSDSTGVNDALFGSGLYDNGFDIGFGG